MKLNHTFKVERSPVGAALALLILIHSSTLLMADGEKIQFSAPGSSASSTNSAGGMSQSTSEFNRLSFAPNTFKQLQDDMLHPIHNAQESSDSMQGVFSMPRHSSANKEESTSESSVRARHDRDKKKNWAFSLMNDLDGKSASTDSKEEAIISGSDPNKPDAGVLEQFVFGKGGGDVSNRASQVQWSDAGRDDMRGRGLAGDSNDQFGQRNSGLSGSMDNSIFSDQRSSTDLTLGGNGRTERINSGTTKMDTDAMQKHHENFKGILDGSFSQTSGSGTLRSSSDGVTGGNGMSSQFSTPRFSAFSSSFGDGGSAGGIRKSSLFENTGGGGGFTGSSFSSPQRNNFTQPSGVSAVPSPSQSPFDSVIKRPKL
jgi:hypothetical protein